MIVKQVRITDLKTGKTTIKEVGIEQYDRMLLLKDRWNCEVEVIKEREL